MSEQRLDEIFPRSETVDRRAVKRDAFDGIAG
jgi:hypothetical protein